MEKYINLLRSLISTPSVSKDESRAAGVIQNFLTSQNVTFHTKNNNTWALNKHYDKNKPVILLISHIDTVKPAKGYTKNPYSPVDDGDKLYGLGSNDAGGPLVSLLATFMHFYERENLSYNLIYAATAEEEISGKKGFKSILPEVEPINFAIVGEPTCMELAMAEKGLLVIDCYTRGKSGHAARNEGESALYKALDDIEILRNYRFEKKSDLLGEVKITITQIKAGVQHNVIPDVCHFVADIRTNEHYSNHEIVKIIENLIKSKIKPRSFRLNSSIIETDHPFVQKALKMGIRIFGSPTTSDQAIIPYPSVKIGPGDSARSHTADEYILKSEIHNGVKLYIKLLEGLKI